MAANESIPDIENAVGLRAKNLARTAQGRRVLISPQHSRLKPGKVFEGHRRPGDSLATKGVAGDRGHNSTNLNGPLF